MKFLYLPASLALAAVLWTSSGSFAATKSPVAEQLPDSCIEDLAKERLYEKYKLQSYATIAPGKDGWYFRTETDLRMDFAFDDEALIGFKTMSDALKAKGITLVVANIPTKGLAVPQMVPPELAAKFEFDAEAAMDSYKHSIKQMRKAGVHMVGVDSFDPNEPFYLKADQHWSQQGADRMAQAVAKYVRGLPVYKTLPKQEFKTVIKGKQEYTGKYGDALRKICDINPPPEQDNEAVTSAAAQSSTASALFGDQPMPEVVLIGTSNSKRERDSNFAGALKQHLGTDVANEAIAGVGYDDPFLIYLESAEFKTNPPKVIIWEIPGYYKLNGGKDIYSTLPATVQGVCAAAEGMAKDIAELDDDKVTLFDAGEGDQIPAGGYLALEFADPVKKSFTVTLYAGKDRTKRVKFSVSGRTKERSSFMTMLGDQTKKVILSVPKGQDGKKLSARLCPAVKG